MLPEGFPFHQFNVIESLRNSRLYFYLYKKYNSEWPEMYNIVLKTKNKKSSKSKKCSRLFFRALASRWTGGFKNNLAQQSEHIGQWANLNTSDSGLHHTISLMYVGARHLGFGNT